MKEGKEGKEDEGRGRELLKSEVQKLTTPRVCVDEG